jgi:hypothetical protein
MKYIIIFSICILLAIPLISADTQKFFHVGIDSNGQIIYSVIENTLYYQGLFFVGQLPPDNNYTLQIFDSKSQKIKESGIYPYTNNNIDFDGASSRFVILNNHKQIFTRDISFCNTDGKCDPCQSSECTLMENSLTCSDCPSGGQDYYCDLAKDGICDPDCNNRDADCPECGSACWYTDSTLNLTTCRKTFSGEACLPGKQCTGKFVYADDSGSLCCTRGECVDDTQVIHTPEPLPAAKPKSSGLSQDTRLLLFLGVIVFLIIVAYFVIKRNKGGVI